MNHRAKYCPEGVFVRGGGGGGGGGGGLIVAYSISYEISFYFFVLQHLQAAGAIQKNLYYIFVISLFSVSNDINVFLSTNYIYISIDSLLFVK